MPWETLDMYDTFNTSESCRIHSERESKRERKSSVCVSDQLSLVCVSPLMVMFKDTSRQNPSWNTGVNKQEETEERYRDGKIMKLMLYKDGTFLLHYWTICRDIRHKYFHPEIPQSAQWFPHMLQTSWDINVTRNTLQIKTKVWGYSARTTVWTWGELTSNIH